MGVSYYHPCIAFLRGQSLRVSLKTPPPQVTPLHCFPITGITLKKVSSLSVSPSERAPRRQEPPHPEFIPSFQPNA